MTQITDQNFSSLPSNGWTDYVQHIGGTKPPIVTDATAPKSPSNVVEFNYPVGLQSGGDDINTPGQIWCDNPGFSYRTIYACWYQKYSSNWDGEVTTMNKTVFIRNAVNQGEIVICGIGTGTSDPIYATIYMQGLDGGGLVDGAPGDGTTGRYISSKALTRNTWKLIEVVTTTNTAGNLDGTCTLYVDGVLGATATGVKYDTTGPDWTVLGFNPIWGGGGDTIAGSAQQLWIDHIYMSGKN